MQQCQHILFVSHGISDDSSTVKQALSLAHNNQAQLKVLIVCPGFPASLEEYKDIYQKSLIENIGKSIALCQRELGFKNNPNRKIDIEIEDRAPYDISIIQRVIRDGYDLIIKAVEPSKTNVGFKVLDMELLRKCPCAILMCRPSKHALQSARVAVAIDPESEEVSAHDLAVKLLKIADSLVKLNGKELNIISCWHVPHENAFRNSPILRLPTYEVENLVQEKQSNHLKELNSLINQSQLESKYHVNHQKGIPEKIIPQFIEEKQIDILVMGTVARTGIPGFIIGNTAENILQKINCSLLVLKPNGFVTPVKAY
jgi:universal stress protein E